MTFCQKYFALSNSLDGGFKPCFVPERVRFDEIYKKLYPIGYNFTACQRTFRLLLTKKSYFHRLDEKMVCRLHIPTSEDH